MTDISTIKQCFTDPSSSSCLGDQITVILYNTTYHQNVFIGTYSTAGSIPSKISDITTVTACMADPTSSSCTAAYGATSSLPSVLSGTLKVFQYTSKCGYTMIGF